MYHKHPEPDAAAAIMVSDSFDPQIQGFLFNYTEAAKELCIEEALNDNLAGCGCHSAFKVLRPEDLGPEGHVCTFDTTNLRWGYLSSLTTRGKKFRLPASEDSVTKELNIALANYVQWATKQDESPARVAKLNDWAEAVRGKALQNWRSAQAKRPLGHMDGFPGLKQAIQEARTHLVFTHDDRAPHGMSLVCKRWYQRQMALYLKDTEVFEEVLNPWEDVEAQVKTQVGAAGFKVGTGIPYNYGIWKPKKRKFRFIAGTRAGPRQEADDNGAPAKGPPRAPTYYMCKSLVKVLDHVGNTLQALDERRQRETGLRCYWPIKSVNEFTRLIRVHADEVVRQGIATYDFTMYTSFSQDVILHNVMEAFK